MVIRPPHINAYEFVVVSSLRAKQLLAGCVAHFAEPHNAATMAQMEVAAGRIARVDLEIDSARPSSVPVS